MSNNPWPDMRIDLGLHARNKAAVPLDYLISFYGKEVAWHADGTHIVAAADSEEELSAELERLGIDFQDVVFAHIDRPDEVWI